MSLSSALNPQGTIHAFADLLQPIPAGVGKAKALTPHEVREAARLEGFDRGYQAGFEQATRDVHSQQEALTMSLADHIAAVQGLLHRLDDELQAALDEWSVKMADPVAELALAVAIRLVGAELRSNPELAVSMAKDALREVTHAMDARLKVNPADAMVLRQVMPELLNGSLSLRSIDIIEERTIAAGCRIETDGGNVDATIESMIEQARRAIRLEDEA